MVLCAAFCVCAFVIAGIFSSMVSTSSGNEVLISSPDCGYTSAQLDDPNTLAAQTFEPYLRQNALAYAQYAQQCYRMNASTVVDCSKFVKRNLTGTSQTDASCAFADNICQSDSANLDLDTGLLDSNDDFGLNAAPEKRFQYRRRVQCALLKTDGYKRVYRTRSGKRYMRYYYGERASGGAETDKHTYEYYDESLTDLIETNMTSAQPDYTLSALHSFSVNSTVSPSSSNFLPIPPLRIPNADVSIFFLSGNQVIYTVPTNDTWYRGNTSIPAKAPLPPLLLAPSSSPETQQDGGGGSSDSQYYISSEAASPLACAVQEQYCSGRLPPDRRCSLLGSSADALADITARIRALASSSSSSSSSSGGGDGETLTRFKWLASVMGSSTAGSSSSNRPLDMAAAVGRLGAQLLTGRGGLGPDGVQRGALLPAQWQADVMHWHATTMAALQGAFVETATGPAMAAAAGEGLMPWLVRPEGPVEEAMCRNQKIRSQSHTSFALFPLFFILAAGALVILTSWILPALLVSIARRRLVRFHRRLSSHYSSSPESPPPAAAENNTTTNNDDDDDDGNIATHPALANTNIDLDVDSTTYARYEWLATSTPQLVRLAHERVPGVAAAATWTRAARNVPITTANPTNTSTNTNNEKPHNHNHNHPLATAAAAASLDLSNPHHPRLAPAAPAPPPVPKKAKARKNSESNRKKKKKNTPSQLSLLTASGARDGGGGGGGAGGAGGDRGGERGGGGVEMRMRHSPQPKLPEIRLREVSGGSTGGGSERTLSTAMAAVVAGGGGVGGGEGGEGSGGGGSGGGGDGRREEEEGGGRGRGQGAGEGGEGGRGGAGTGTTGPDAVIFDAVAAEQRLSRKETREEARRREREREDVLLSEPLLPDYENWPLPPSGSLTPTLSGENEGEGGGRKQSGGGAAAAEGNEAGQLKKKRSDGAFL
ncbi:hypothetical protein SLS58_001526 [Diplodia intermedia]|uniref:Uncharacterized protein n=1 Tax=Diplodia intermedia TaxID=856260 RepID=A0ABR3U2G9_9PEZI